MAPRTSPISTFPQNLRTLFPLTAHLAARIAVHSAAGGQCAIPVLLPSLGANAALPTRPNILFQFACAARFPFTAHLAAERRLPQEYYVFFINNC